MQISRVQANSYLSFLQQPSRKDSGPTPMLGARNMDSVHISEEARRKLAVAMGEAEPELNEMGKLMSSQLESILELGADTGEYTKRSQLLPGNYDKLKAIESEIALGNDSQEMQDKKLLLILFGDTRELTDADLQEGIEMLNELMPDRNVSLSFSDLVTALRKSAGMGDTSTSAAQKNGVEEDGEDMAPETRLMMEELKDFLEQSKGASISITLNGDRKETQVTLGPDEYGNETLRLQIDGTIPVNKES